MIEKMLNDESLREDTTQFLLEVLKEQTDYWRQVRRSAEAAVGQYREMRFRLQEERVNQSPTLLSGVLTTLLWSFAPLALGKFVIGPILRRAYYIMHFTRSGFPTWMGNSSRALAMITGDVTALRIRQLDLRSHELTRFIQSPASTAIKGVIQNSIARKGATNTNRKGVAVKDPKELTLPSVRNLASISRTADVNISAIEYKISVLIYLIQSKRFSQDEVKELRDNIVRTANTIERSRSRADYDIFWHFTNVVESILWALTYKVELVEVPEPGGSGFYSPPRFITRIRGIPVNTLDYLAKRLLVPQGSISFLQRNKGEKDKARAQVAKHLIAISNAYGVQQELFLPKLNSIYARPRSSLAPNPVAAFANFESQLTAQEAEEQFAPEEDAQEEPFVS